MIINSVLSPLRSLSWISQRLIFSMQHSIERTASSWDVLLGCVTNKFETEINLCVIRLKRSERDPSMETH